MQLVLCAVQVVHVEMVRAYGSLLKLVVQRGETIRQLRTATAKLQKEAGIWTEVEAKLEDDVLALREKLAGIYREIQVGVGCMGSRVATWLKLCLNSTVHNVQGVVLAD